MDISFVIPCYKSSETLDAVVNEIIDTVNDLNMQTYEIVLVNDCSPDQGATWKKIKQLHENNSAVIGINLAKNSGQAAATLAGMRFSKGNLVVVTDDDGQTPVCELPKMLAQMNEYDYDVVCAEYKGRGKRSVFRRFGSWMSGKLTRSMLDCPPGKALTAFFVARHFVVEEMVNYKSPYPYILGLLARTTHNIGNIVTEQRGRISGASGYNFKKLLALFMDGMTAFSVKPLRIASVFGFVMAALGFIFGVVTIIRKLVDPTILVGYSSIIAVLLLSSGIIMLMLGMIGEYIGRIYISLNNKPQYTVKEALLDDNKNEMNK